jgi:hypothetical protein
MKEKGFWVGCFCIHITTALFMYNAFFGIGYPAYPRSIADVKSIRLLEDLSTASVDVLNIVGLVYETQILSPFPFINKRDFVFIVFMYNRGQGRYLFQGPAYISSFVTNAIDNAIVFFILMIILDEDGVVADEDMGMVAENHIFRFINLTEREILWMNDKNMAVISEIINVQSLFLKQAEIQSMVFHNILY